MTGATHGGVDLNCSVKLAGPSLHLSCLQSAGRVNLAEVLSSPMLDQSINDLEVRSVNHLSCHITASLPALVVSTSGFKGCCDHFLCCSHPASSSAAAPSRR